MIKLVNFVNGHIRHGSTLVQFHRTCALLGIKALAPYELSPNSRYFVGFWEADGTITFSIKNNHPELTISVSNKKHTDLLIFKEKFGGEISYDTGSNGSYK